MPQRLLALKIVLLILIILINSLLLLVLIRNPSKKLKINKVSYQPQDPNISSIMNTEIDFNVHDKRNSKAARYIGSQEEATFLASQTVQPYTENDKYTAWDLLKMKQNLIKPLTTHFPPIKPLIIKAKKTCKLTPINSLVL